MSDTPRTDCPYKPRIADTTFACQLEHGHAGRHCFVNEQPDFTKVADRITFLERELAAKQARIDELMKAEKRVPPPAPMPDKGGLVGGKSSWAWPWK